MRRAARGATLLAMHPPRSEIDLAAREITAADLAACRRFSAALADRDVSAALAEAHPAIELHMPRGVMNGASGVRALLAGAGFDHLEQTVFLDDVVADGPRALAIGRIELRWRETGELADCQRVTALLEVRDGRVARWSPVS